MDRSTSDSASGADLLKRPWTPFFLCQPDARDPESIVYRKSRYQVHLRRNTSPVGGPDLVHLSFRRGDRGILIPYEDKLRIKNEIVAPECEGVELLPARSREVDTANQFHLWVIDSERFRFPLSARVHFPCTTSPATAPEQDLLKVPWTALLPCGGDHGGIIYRNSRYQIRLQRLAAQDGGPDVIQLSCQLRDGSPLIPYRDKMRIKDELVGPECEGIELVPACSRAVSSMAGCVLWVIDDTTFRFPFGFAQRCVSDMALDGAVQEPWPPEERPADCLSEDELRAFIQKEEDTMMHNHLSTANAALGETREDVSTEQRLLETCFRVASRCCRECLFGPHKLVSDERKAAIVAECLREDRFFRCHIGDANGQTICCRGFFEVHGCDVFPIRLARCLAEQFPNTLRFVDVEEDTEQTGQVTPLGEEARGEGNIAAPASGDDPSLAHM